MNSNINKTIKEVDQRPCPIKGRSTSVFDNISLKSFISDGAVFLYSPMNNARHKVNKLSL